MRAAAADGGRDGTGASRRDVAIAFAAILCAVAGQGLVVAGRPVTGTVMLVLAIPLAAVGFRRLLPALPEETSAEDPGSSESASLPRWRRATGWTLLAIAIASGSGALFLFPLSHPVAWPLHLAAGVFLVAGAAFLSRPAAGRARPGAAYLAGLLAILVLAAALRLWQLSEVPFGTFWDEANNALAALDLPGRPGAVFVDETQLPAHHFHLLAFALKVAGVTTLPGRLLSAAFGLASVLLGFFLGRELHGDRFGLGLAFLLAVSRWPLTFSRNGLVIVSALFFALLAALFLLRARRSRAPVDFALAGLALGLGGCFYFAARLVALPAGVFLLAWALSRRRPLLRTGGSRRAALGRLSLLAVGGLLAASPIVQFALRNTDRFLARTSDVSIFRMRDEPDLARALASNTAKHALMMNVAGDRNGRHNVPGEPMLDVLSGVLFVLGLGAALSRANEPGTLLLLTLLPAGLLGGILTLDFEAPQAARSIAAAPAVLYLVALGAAGTERLLRRVLPAGAGRLAGRTAAALAGTWLVGANVGSYFRSHEANDAVFGAHNPRETAAANRLRALDRLGTAVYASAYLHGNVVLRFLARDTRGTRPLLLPLDLPLPESGDRPASILVDDDNTWILRRVADLYPHARVLAETTPEGRTYLRTVMVPVADLRAASGLEARYWRRTATPGAAPEIARVEAAPGGGATALPPPYVAEWTGLLAVRAWGSSSFVLRVPGHGTLDVDGTRVAEGRSEASGRATLAVGLHRLRVTVEADAAGPPSTLLWQPAVPAGAPAPPLAPVPREALFRSPPVRREGLRASLFENDSFGPPAAVERIDPFLDAYFHVLPLQRPYSALWTGSLLAPADGAYGFLVRVTGKARLALDGRTVVEASGVDVSERGTATLAKGPHAITVEFVDSLQASRLHLSWTPPGGEEEILPSSALRPEP